MINTQSKKVKKYLHMKSYTHTVRHTDTHTHTNTHLYILTQGSNFDSVLQYAFVSNLPAICCNIRLNQESNANNANRHRLHIEKLKKKCTKEITIAESQPEIGTHMRGLRGWRPEPTTSRQISEQALTIIWGMQGEPVTTISKGNKKKNMKIAKAKIETKWTNQARKFACATFMGLPSSQLARAQNYCQFFSSSFLVILRDGIGIGQGLVWGLSGLCVCQFMFIAARIWLLSSEWQKEKRFLVNIRHWNTLW